MNDAAVSTVSSPAGSATVPVAGNPVPGGGEPTATPTPHAALDAAVSELRAASGSWASLDLGARIDLLAGMTADFRALAGDWVAAARQIERVPDAGPGLRGEEWLAGPYCVLRAMRLYRESLEDLREGRAPRLPAPPFDRAGRAVAPVFPASLWDRAFFPGVTAEVWMEPGVRAADLPHHQAAAYRAGAGVGDRGRVALVLGAGNVSSIGPLDTLHKLFAEKQVVLYKSHPVQDRLGPLFERVFARAVDAGWVRVVYGGGEVGEYLVSHPGIDEIHMTGSDRTYETIVFGPGEEGRARKRRGEPRIDKRVTAELGNVSPVIVVPGPWSRADLELQAENLAAMLTNNAGFNCNAARVIVTWRDWPLRDALLAALRRVLSRTPPRPAFYPGAGERYARFVAAHPEAERLGGEPAGGGDDEALPWTLIADLDPEAEDEIAFRTEAFCGVFAETALEAASPARFVSRAVDFANQRLWGTLNAGLIVHPESLADRQTAAAVERAETDLRYGTVAINHWAAVGYALQTTSWGAYPGHSPADVQSGIGAVHNTFLFDRPEKSIVRAPFRAFPKPPWFAGHRHAGALAAKLSAFEADPSVVRLPAILWNALRG